MPAAYPDVVPTLTDGTVTLRAHRESDIGRIVEQINDPRSQRWITVPLPYDATHARAFLAIARASWEEDTARYWAIEVDGRFAGTINYSRRDGQRAEIGFGLHADARGIGATTRAAQLALEWAFNTDGIESMAWRAALDNLASRRVAWACGFTIDGIWRQQHSNADELREDCLVGSLLKGEPRTPRHPWWEPKVLEGERVRLRPWRADDIPTVWPDEAAELYNEGMQPTPDNFEEWRAWRLTRMAHGEGVFWCIADAETDEVLGGIQTIRLNIDFTAGTGLIGYWLHAHARGRGATQDALDLLIPHAFTARKDQGGLTGLGLHRLQAGADGDNRASQRALRRAGFRELGRRRAALAHEDRPPTDDVMFELLDTDDRVTQMIEPADVPVLMTVRLRLRPWRADDVPREDQELDRASLQFMPAGAQPTTATFDAWLNRRQRQGDLGDLHWCIADAATDTPFGTISLFHIGQSAPGDAEVGYWLYGDARGRRYLQEALPAVIELAFQPVADDGLGLTRLHAATDIKNLPSQKLLEHNGFHRWGEDHRSYRRSDGSLSDGAYFELLATTHADAGGAAAAAEATTRLEVPTLAGDKVRLRPWRESDIPRVVEGCTDSVTRHWLSGLPDPYTEDSARDWIGRMPEKAAARQMLGWCVADPSTDECLAAVSLMDLDGPDPTTGEIGYWTTPGARGRGAMSEATRLVVNYALRPEADGGLGLRRLRLNVADGNDRSAAIPRRLGFTEVGRDRLAEPLDDGSHVDLIRFDLLATEWADRDGRPT